jgi:hypothetical protein
LQDKDDEDEDLEHGKAHDDMWILDTVKYTVNTLYTISCIIIIIIIIIKFPLPALLKAIQDWPPAGGPTANQVI